MINKSSLLWITGTSSFLVALLSVHFVVRWKISLCILTVQDRLLDISVEDVFGACRVSQEIREKALTPTELFYIDSVRCHKVV